jgi:hypothetical protein
MGKTICKIVLQKIRKARIMTVERILNTGINCAFEIFRKTPLLKTDADRFGSKTICVCFKLLAFYETASYNGGKNIGEKYYD